MSRQGDPTGGAGRQTGLQVGQSRTAAFALVLVLVFGGWLRLVDLGGAPFFADELNHYYAATEMAAGNGPRLPSGNEYRRGLDFTRLVRASLAVIDDPHTAARAPSAFLGILSLVLIGMIGWRWGGPWAGVWAALLLAIYPEAVVQGRQARFYTYQMCFALIALFTGWRVIAPDRERHLIVRYGWFILTIVAFAAAFRVQVTSLSVVAGWASATAMVAVNDLVTRGRRSWATSPALQIVGLGVGLAVGIALFRPSIYQGLAQRATYVALWAGDGGDIRSYYWILVDAVPVLLAFSPVIFLAVVIRRAWLAAYLALWFAVPLAAHTFAFPWKAERYVFAAMPGLFLAAGIAVAAGCGALSERVGRAIRHHRPSVPEVRSVWIARGAVLLAVVFGVGTSRALNESLERPTSQPLRYWTEALRVVEAEGLRDVPLGSSEPLAALFYWKRLDFTVGSDFLEGFGEERRRPDGSPDWYTGVPVLTLPQSIRSRFPGAKEFAIAVDRGRWDYGNVAPELREKLSREGEELCREACGDLLLFRWSPDGAEMQEPEGGEPARPGEG